MVGKSNASVGGNVLTTITAVERFRETTFDHSAKLEVFPLRPVGDFPSFLDRSVPYCTTQTRQSLDQFTLMQNRKNRSSIFTVGQSCHLVSWFCYLTRPPAPINCVPRFATAHFEVAWHTCRGYSFEQCKVLLRLPAAAQIEPAELGCNFAPRGQPAKNVNIGPLTSSVVQKKTCQPKQKSHVPHGSYRKRRSIYVSSYTLADFGLQSFLLGSARFVYHQIQMLAGDGIAVTLLIERRECEAVL